MKRNATEMTYYYHVVMVNNQYKVKRSIFYKMEGSLFYASKKENAEKHITLLIQSAITN